MCNTRESLYLNSSSIDRQYNLSNIEPALEDVFGWYRESEPLLQPAWSVVLSNRQIFESPLFPIALALFCYFGSTVPFTILDFYGYRHWKWVKRIKIQPEIEVKWSQVRESIFVTAWNQLFYVLPVSVAQCVWTPKTILPPLAPSAVEILFLPYVALAIVDVEYYLWHVLHHRVRWLYRTVHAVHHKYPAVNAWVGQYVHPWELICAGIFATTAPLILGLHPLTTWTFMAFIQYVSVEDHCGYDISVMPHAWLLPEVVRGGPVKHDMHHQRPTSNLEPYFAWIDWLMGTDWSPKGGSVTSLSPVAVTSRGEEDAGITERIKREEERERK